jgi:O-acetyl-ADP-ribose deacetylase (regulator of RNase III)
MNIKHDDAIRALLNGEIEVLIHGCNCFNTMGAGIAKAIKEQFPLAYDLDQSTVYGDYNKLGTIGVAKVGRFGKAMVVNAYTQYKYGGSGQLVDYCALRLCLRKVANDTILSTRRIGLPIIGCGLAGGEWSIVREIIEEELPQATVYVLAKDAERIRQ